MGIVLMIHSLVRWVIVVVAVAAIVKFALGWLNKMAYSGMDRGLTSGFSGLLDLQALLGIIYLVWNGLSVSGFPIYRVEHAVVMIAAVIVGHLPTRWRNAPDALKYGNNLIAVAGALVIVFIGVAILPGGWSR